MNRTYDTGYSSDGTRACFSTDERRIMNRFLRLQKEYPDEVEITHRPEDNDGCMCGWFPASWIRINPPKKNSLTEDQIEERRERMRQMVLSRRAEAKSPHEKGGEDV